MGFPVIYIYNTIDLGSRNANDNLTGLLNIDV